MLGHMSRFRLCVDQSSVSLTGHCCLQDSVAVHTTAVLRGEVCSGCPPNPGLW